MKFSDIHMRDPYILPDNGKYYLYGTRGAETWGESYGFDVYESDDLENWSEPIEVFTPPEDFWSHRNFWAPEVHKYKGKYYMLATFGGEEGSMVRGTQILVSDSPLGPFCVHSDGPVTPKDWSCLDGTLYIEEGVPYMIFCHEWVQVNDGEMCAVRLSDDLKCSVGEPFILFRGSEPEWASKNDDRYITDGPFVYKCQDGKILLLWSSVRNGKYIEAVSYPENGKIADKWLHEEKLFFEENGGHGMLFETFDGKLMLALHAPNNNPCERPVLFFVEEKNGQLNIQNN